MKIVIKILFLFLISLTINSCGKGHGLDCFKGTGDIINESRTAGLIHRIILQDNVNLILTQDSIEAIVVEAGEKIINSIKTDLVNGELSIENTNRCNWARSYKKEINVYVSVTDLANIVYYGSGDITSINEIKSDLLEVDIYNGAGSINLNINTSVSWFNLSPGVADITVKGNSEENYIYAGGFGPIDCINLITQITFINNNGSNNCFVNVEEFLEAKIGSVGDIYYKGDPQTIDSEITGSGRLINLD